MIDIFSIKDFKFPKGFAWGSATAGHQIEGDNIYSDFWHNEQKEHSLNPDYPVSGKACNSYELYEEDSKLLYELKHQVYRMSVEWSRIEPSEGDFRQSEVDHYIKVFESLRTRGIKICLTLIHFVVPQWFIEKGGFEKMENLVYFERYVNYIVPKVAQYIDSWCVLNEANMAVTSDKYIFKMNSVRFHARAYHIIKQYSDKPISTAHGFICMYGKRQGDKFDMAVQNYYDVLCNEYFFHAIRTGELVVPGCNAVYDEEIKGTCDYWAVNTYLRRMIDTRKKDNRGDRYRFSEIPLIPDMKFYINEFNPECIIQNLCRLRDKPVVITENGLSTDDDEFRIMWLVEYLSALRDVIDMGIDVRGYYYWSLLDNYEWGSFRPRFGLVDVDRENGFKRTVKPSGYFFKEIIENNGFSQDILRKYLNSVPTLNKRKK